MSSLSFLLLAGCHVFETVEVTCTSDMPCAQAVDTAVDSGGDTAVETGDTGPVGTPTVGWVTSMTGGGNSIVRVFDPVSGEVTAEWADFGPFDGTPYYDPGNQTALLVTLGYVIQLLPDGSVGVVFEGPATAKYDVTHLGNKLLAAYQGGLTEVSADLGDSSQPVPAGTLDDIKFVGGNVNVAYYVDPSSGGPDLWKIDTAGTTQLMVKDYDTSHTRATNVFVGPEEGPYGCSSAGAIYSIDALAGGDTHPAVFFDDGLTDVTDCVWDPGNETYLLYSASKGVLQVDRFGHGTWLFTPSAGYTYARVFWYGN